MEPLSLPRFPHRYNHDGTIDSICKQCFQTVASHKKEIEIEQIEKAHVCSSSLLSQRGGRASLDSSR
jgi:hypothetical protein